MRCLTTLLFLVVCSNTVCSSLIMYLALVPVVNFLKCLRLVYCCYYCCTRCLFDYYGVVRMRPHEIDTCRCVRTPKQIPVAGTYFIPRTTTYCRTILYCRYWFEHQVTVKKGNILFRTREYIPAGTSSSSNKEPRFSGFPRKSASPQVGTKKSKSEQNNKVRLPSSISPLKEQSTAKNKEALARPTVSPSHKL